MESDRGIVGRWYIAVIEHSPVQQKDIVFLDWDYRWGFIFFDEVMDAYNAHPFKQNRKVVRCVHSDSGYEYTNGNMVY